MCERVTTKGVVYALDHEDLKDALSRNPQDVGRVSQHGPIKKWIEKRDEFDQKYAEDLLALNDYKTKERELSRARGWLTGDLHGENPPACAIASWNNMDDALAAIKHQDSTKSRPVATNTNGLAMWMKLSQKADEKQAGPEQVRETGEDLGINPEVAVPVAPVKDSPSDTGSPTTST